MDLERTILPSHTITMDVVNKITEGLDHRKVTICVFIDLSKAFDTIEHDILYDKLGHNGITGLALKWLKRLAG